MIKSAGRYGVFIVLFLLAGCFQQAGESLQSTDNTIAPISQDNPTVVAPTTDQIQPSDVASATPRPASSGPVTATLPPITIIVQPTSAPRLTQVTATPNADEPASGQSAGGATATTVQFITPGIPLGPSLDTATSTSPGGAVT
ncbi:MAG: hypothetical protein K8J31_03800, partial [Anaerolineae bacterium]|nr:hypothetical protein [Anaerolineae bacterium]